MAKFSEFKNLTDKAIKIALDFAAGGKFDPKLYMAWHGLDPSVNPYRHGLKFGFQQFRAIVTNSFSSTILKKNDDKKNWALVVSHDCSRTGAPILALNILKELQKDYRVAVLVLGPGEIKVNFEKDADFFVEDFRVRRTDKGFPKRLSKLIAKIKPEFAIVNSIESSVVVKALVASGVKTTLLIHEYMTYTDLDVRKKDGLEAANLTVFSSSFTQKNALDFSAISKTSRMSIIPQGVTVAPARNSSSANGESQFLEIQTHLGVKTASKIRIVGAGFVQYRKGVDLAIEAINRLKNENSNLEIRACWIGGGYNPGSDHQYSAFLGHQLLESQLGEIFRFFPASDKVFEVLRDFADVFILPSRLDPLPNIAIEAMAIGVPVVFFDQATGISELFTSQVSEAKFAANYISTNHFAEKIFKAFEYGKVSANRINLGQTIQEQLSMELYVKKVLHELNR